MRIDMVRQKDTNTIDAIRFDARFSMEPPTTETSKPQSPLKISSDKPGQMLDYSVRSEEERIESDPTPSSPTVSAGSI
jgi:hypothetical protein